MGVTYKLTEEVVQFIIQHRQSNARLSCRELAEAVETSFGLHVSKSSIHDVLKQANIATPRGRKPKDTFQIPPEKKEQIKISLSKIILSPEMDLPEVKIPIP